MRPQESACIEKRAELSVVVHLLAVLFTKCECFLEKSVLNCGECRHGGLGDAVLRDE